MQPQGMILGVINGLMYEFAGGHLLTLAERCARFQCDRP